jgi:predicted amidophosphoribosyltransferase
MFTNRITSIFALLFPKKKEFLSIQEFHSRYRYARCSPGNERTKLFGDFHTIAPYIYKNTHIKPAILDIKRGVFSTRSIALVESLADELIEEQYNRILNFNSSGPAQALLVHVPSSAYTQGKKNFDHMELCVVQIEKLCENFCTTVTGAIQINKSKLKESQHKLNKRERIFGAKDKFYLSNQFVKHVQSLDPENLHIYCIDDITTSGATFLSISKLIKESFPTAVITCIAIAR